MTIFRSENVPSADNQQERPQGINPWYISGFVDGEGTFHVSFARRTDLPKKWAIIPEFHVSQDFARSSVLEEIKTSFDCGQIKQNHRGKSNDSTYVFVVRNRQDLINKIIPFFDRYPMRSSKQKDFLVFAQIVALMENGYHRSEKGFREITWKAFQMNGGGKYRKRKMAEILEESSETICQNVQD